MSSAARPGGPIRLVVLCAAIALTMAALPRAAFAENAVLSPAIEKTIAALKQDAAKSDLGFEITRDLVRDVGSRMAGTDAEARARTWAVARFEALGHSARIEPFTVNMWRRTHQDAAIVAPFNLPVVIAALGGSAATPAGGLEADVVRFANIPALTATAPESVIGKIVFIDEKMARSQDGSTYGAAVAKRRRCPLLAREKGAAACLIRTVGTSPLRVANTGNITSRETRIIPAAALSNPDADELAYLLTKGPVRMRLDIGVETQPDAPSGNVIVDIKGRERPNEIVLLGAHLDSWDVTPGAHDDGAGVGTMMAVAKLIASLPHRPRRTIRIVLFGSEEVGLIGGMAYAKAHQDELKDHILASESDFGGETIWRLRTKFGPGGAPYAAAMASAVGDLAIPPSDQPAEGESEVGLLAAAGVPVFDLDADGTKYFDVHHTPNDVISGVDPATLRQNVAAYAALAYIAAESGWDFRAK